MQIKTWILIGMTAGSIIGGYLPALWGAGVFSYSSVIGSTIGGLAGIWLGYKAGHMIGG